MAEGWRSRSLLLAALVVMWTSGRVDGVTRARLENNGYEGVVVALSPDVREQDGPALVEALKELFSATSEGLYQATDFRAYFRSVTILIPRTWSSVTTTDTAGSESFQNSDIRVDDMNPVYQHQPYTEQPSTRCGVPGQYIHLTPNYLLNDTIAASWGPRDKTLLMEWAKLRWGVYDELGYPDDLKYPAFYREEPDMVISPTHCADPRVSGRHRDNRDGDACSKTQTGLPEEHCRFIPNKTQSTTSSLLSYPVIMNQKVVRFCGSDGKKHNPNAPTKQNEFCEKRSTWDVISSHVDFNGNANPPTEKFQKVAVRVVQQADANYALVLDYSGSMKGTRIENLRKTARRWLLEDVANGSYVAIINFSSSAKIVRHLTKITDDTSSRMDLASVINTNVGGGTSIGSGLIMAAKTVLAGKSNPVILLITDGDENEDPRIDDVLDEVIASGARVVTVAFGSAADPKLEKVAKNTGGKTFTERDTNSQGLMDAFQGTLTFQPPPPAADQKVQIDDKQYQVSGNEASGNFNVDSTLGRNLTLSLETANSVTSMPTLTGPDGQKYSATLDSYSSSYTVKVPLAKEGLWTWKVGVSGSNPVMVRVTSQSSSPDVKPIRTNAWLSNAASDVNAAQDKLIVYAEVKQGNMPVLKADVRAHVTPPRETDQIETYQLFDNGTGADATANDGTYSRYITKFSSTGRYSVKAQVSDGGNAVINRGLFITSQRRRKRKAGEEDEDKEEESEEYLDYFLKHPSVCCGSVIPIPEDAPVTGSFERTASGGSFKVTVVPQPQDDVYAPDRVRDLQVKLLGAEWLAGSSSINATLSLTWTAPGDDLDSGIVSGYELRMTTNRSDLLEDNFIPNTSNSSSSTSSNSSTWRVVDLSGQPVAVEGGTQLNFNISITLPMNMTYFALRAWDDAYTMSSVSNTVTLYVDTSFGKAGGKVPTWAWWWWCCLFCVKYLWW